MMCAKQNDTRRHTTAGSSLNVVFRIDWIAKRNREMTEAEGRTGCSDFRTADASIGTGRFSNRDKYNRALTKSEMYVGVYSGETLIRLIS